MEFFSKQTVAPQSPPYYYKQTPLCQYVYEFYSWYLNNNNNPEICDLFCRIIKICELLILTKEKEKEIGLLFHILADDLRYSKIFTSSIALKLKEIELTLTRNNSRAKLISITHHLETQNQSNKHLDQYRELFKIIYKKATLPETAKIHTETLARVLLTLSILPKPAEFKTLISRWM